MNNVLKITALACFVASLGVIVVRVPDASLVVVLLIVIAMTIYDFLIRPMLLRNGNNGQPRS
ncbi:MAG TPA: hypothetical protein VJ822_19130 [Dongiaceae bacterium]|nr:hypothetical protein [Dongiaceae bacterium]